MSDLMTVVEVQGLSGLIGWADRLRRTALAWRAELDAVGDRLVGENARALTDALNAVKAERDTVTVERDEAYRQRDATKTALDLAMTEPKHVSRAASILCEALLIDDTGEQIDDLAKMAADQIASVRGSLLVPEEGAVEIHARNIRDSLAGERGATVSERVALVMAELRSLREHADELRQIRHTLGVMPDETALQSVVWLKTKLAEFRADFAHQDSMRHEVARVAGLPDATAATWGDVVARVVALAAEAEPPQVFRVAHEVTIESSGNARWVTVSFEQITDPGFLTLSGHQLARLGLVVCDE